MTTKTKTARPRTTKVSVAIEQDSALLAERDALRAERDALRAELDRVYADVATIVAVCARTAQGDLEPRVLGISRAGPLGQLAGSVNHMLDLTDAFIREARASLQHASEERYWRRVLERGLPGSFRGAARLINTATDEMAAKTQRLKDSETSRLRLADEFEAAVKTVVDSVAAAATESRATADSLAGTADHTTSHATMVAAAAEQTSRSMETVAAATEEISATVSQIDDLS